jgi:transcriptional regulator with XRE-family HTH domain
VCNWENGNIQPSIDILVKIANAYSVSADYLLGLESERTLDVSGLSDRQIAYLQSLVDDLRQK